MFICLTMTCEISLAAAICAFSPSSPPMADLMMNSIHFLAYTAPTLCASVEQEFHMLIKHFLKEDFEFYHMDVGDIEMPYQLEPRGVTELFPYQWKDFSGEAYDFRSL
uniref:Uncharacterized protein n=1 Tax=Magallana gigas TaxID=29159 RepID=A0A8W8HVQ6_MAGGI